MRTTIQNTAVFEGIGLHKGRPAKVTFMPAEGPTGLRFTGPGFASPLPALLDRVSGTVRGTNISDGSNTIYTVEHLLSAAAGLGIDDLDIAIEGGEPPAADGSSLPFAETLKLAGLRQKPAQQRRVITLKEKIKAAAGATTYLARPAKGVQIKLTYENPHKLVGRQTVEVSLTPASYLAEVAPARTFGFMHELEALKKAGLGLGGSLDNAIVIADNEVMAKGGLRFPDELARHKLLDLVGDLALAGAALADIYIEAERPGHAGNVNFAKLLLEKAATL